MKGATYSAEIRWFFPRALPDPLVQWFSQEAHLEHEGVRHDRYLLFPRYDTVGVKLREGLLEIKARVAPPGAVQSRTWLERQDRPVGEVVFRRRGD